MNGKGLDIDGVFAVQVTAEEMEALADIAPLDSPPHYKCLKIQPYEDIHANKLGFLEGDIVKRITRLWLKGDRKHALLDLRKIQHECDLIIRLEGLDEGDG